MITDNARTVLSFLASWWGALTLMGLGFVLLWLQVHKQLELVKTAAANTPAPIDLDIPDTGDGLQPETLIGLFKRDGKLIKPYIGQTMTTTGRLAEQFYKGLKEDTSSLVLTRSPNVNIVAHLNDRYTDMVFNMPRGGGITVSGQIIAVDSSSVTLNDCGVIEVKPLLYERE
jgi:hypothetical protein